MGWLRFMGSLKAKVSFAEYRLFYRALLQKRPLILRSLLIVATPYPDLLSYLSRMRVSCLSNMLHTHTHTHTYTHTYIHTYTYTPTHSHTHIHTHTQFRALTCCRALTRCSIDILTLYHIQVKCVQGGQDT